MFEENTARMVEAAGTSGVYCIERISIVEYHRILCNLHEIAVNAVPFMDSAIASLGCLTCRTDADNKFLDYLKKHITEEKGHDRWILEDVAALRAAYPFLGQFDDVPKSPFIGTLVRAQGEFLNCGYTWPLLGHMAAIETRPPAISQIKALRERLGLSDEMVRSYERHAVIDIDHGREIISLLREIRGFAGIWNEVQVGARCTATGIAKYWLNFFETSSTTQISWIT